MAEFAADVFTDTNGTALQSHTASDGGSWTEHGSYTSGAMEIQANRCRPSGGFNNSLFYHSGTPGGSNPAEYDVEADIEVLTDNDGQVGVCGRIDTAANTYYRANKRLNGSVVLGKVVAGTFTSLDSVTGQADVSGRLKLEIRDATKKVYWDDVEILTSTDNEITAAGRAGILDMGSNSGTTTGAHFDNFSATDLAAGASAAVTGTAGDGCGEADIVAGGETIILTLTGDTWVASGATFNAQRQAIIDGLDSAQSEANGWDAERSGLAVTDVVRTSDTVVTITLSALATYAITANETITATIPGAALTGASPVVASPTFVITATAAPSTFAGSLVDNSRFFTSRFLRSRFVR